MNNAKKIIKEQGLQKPDKKEVKAQQKSRKYLILIIIGVLVILGGVFVVCYTQLRPREILTVEGPAANNETTTDKLYYTDSVYAIYKMESMYNQYGMDWDQEQSSSETLSESVKNQIMDTMKKTEVLYMQAQKDGVTLDDTEKQSLDTKVEDAMKDISDHNATGVKGLSESTVRSVIEKQLIADKEKQAIIDGFDIDDEAIKAGVKKADFRQYTLQYYTISKKAEDKDGKEDKQKDEATIKKDRDAMIELQKKAKTADDFTKLLTDEDGDQTDDKTGISYSTENLVETDENFADAPVRNLIKRLQNNQVSEVMETDDAFFVVKMINNNDPEAYDNEVKKKIEEEEDSKFDSYYSDTLSKEYKFTVTKYWRDRVQIGNITV